MELNRTEVIASKVDVFFAIGPAVVRAARSATQTLPIVANDLESDPVETGWAASLAHPGGNITGVFMAYPDFATKWLGLLKDTAPQLSHVAVLWDPSTGLFQKNAIEAAAKDSKLPLEIIEVRTPSDLDGAFNSAKRGGANSLVIQMPLRALKAYPPLRGERLRESWMRENCTSSLCYVAVAPN